MKQAMPNNSQFRAVIDFLTYLEDQIERRKLPADLRDRWTEVESCWRRVLFAGQHAIESACDPTLTFLDWKPEIKQALEAAGIPH